jgi:hypothetical protein
LLRDQCWFSISSASVSLVSSAQLVKLATLVFSSGSDVSGLETSLSESINSNTPYVSPS